MRKICKLTLLIGVLIMVWLFFNPTERASGAAVKSSSAVYTEQNGIEQAGPPWYDPAWRYRIPVTISNSGGGLAYYQVMIKLFNSNFDFSLVNADGSDIRFTDASGKTPLYYWIESWDRTNKLAYLWVLVSNLAQTPDDTTIYLYFGNPAAAPASSGVYTFDFFDDTWCQFPGAGCTQSQVNQRPQSENINNYKPTIDSDWMASDFWSVIDGSPTVSAGILRLLDGTGIKSTYTYHYQAVGYRAMFGLGTGQEWGGFKSEEVEKGTVIGDRIADPTNLFLINLNPNESYELIPRIGGIDWHNAYHIYEVRWKSGQSFGNIDHSPSSVSSTSQVPSTNLPVTFYSYTGSTATLMVDWVYVRQYRNPEPTVTVGAIQGLVDLLITMSDTPDPTNTKNLLTYEIAVTNSSTIDAPGVVVTDTLPASVQFISADAEAGCTHAGGIVICDLGNIEANTTGQASVVVKPTIDDTITNSAIAGTLGYDQDLSNNITYTDTWVETIPPTGYWVLPTTNGQIYTTEGGLVTLKVNASDNDQVSHVEFWWYDTKNYIWISTDTNPPYQTEFDTSILKIGAPIYFDVRVYDRAGNTNFPESRIVIYIQRLGKIYLPTLFR